MKANLLIIRGKRREYQNLGGWWPLKAHADWAMVREEEFVTESFIRLERHAYSEMMPINRGNRGESVFEVVLLVPGQPPIRTEMEFWRGCNGLSMSPKIAELIPPEFFDPIQAVQYAAEHGLEEPPFYDLSKEIR